MLPDLGKEGTQDLGNGHPKSPSPGWPRSWHTQVTSGQDLTEEVVEMSSAPHRGRKYN